MPEIELTDEIIAAAMAKAEKRMCAPGDNRCYAFPYDLAGAQATCTVKGRCKVGWVVRDAGLLAFRQLSDSLGSTHWFLRQLRDESEGAEQLARVLGTSRFVADIITKAPEVVAMFGKESELAPRTRDRLLHEMTAVVRRHSDPHEAIRVVRTMRRRELGEASVLARESNFWLSIRGLLPSELR